MISNENEKELKELGIFCALGFDKISPAEQRILLDFWKALKHIEKVSEPK